MYGPILEDETQDEHEQAQRVIDEEGSHCFPAGFCPDPLQDKHGKAIDRP